jgi:hypothetical protein
MPPLRSIVPWLISAFILKGNDSSLQLKRPVKSLDPGGSTNDLEFPPPFVDKIEERIVMKRMARYEM